MVLLLLCIINSTMMLLLKHDNDTRIGRAYISIDTIIETANDIYP